MIYVDVFDKNTKHPMIVLKLVPYCAFRNIINHQPSMSPTAGHWPPFHNIRLNVNVYLSSSTHGRNPIRGGQKL